MERPAEAGPGRSEILFKGRGGYRNGKPEHDGRGQQQKVGIDR